MSLECPFSPKTVNETAVRLVALFTLTLTLVGILSSLQWIALFLCFDFFVRGFTDRPLSLLRLLAKTILKSLRLKPEMINAGPKIFAAKIGFFFTAIITLTAFMELNLIANVLAVLLILLASLEAFFKVCVGCHLYSALQTLKRNLPLRKNHEN